MINKVYKSSKYYSGVDGIYSIDGGTTITMGFNHGVLVYSSLNASTYTRQEGLVLIGTYSLDFITIDNVTYYS